MRVRVSQIQQAICTYYGLSMAELLGGSRLRSIVRPRQMGMYLSRRYTLRSLPEIGRQFGRDHSTVVHGVHAIEALLLDDDGIERDFYAIRRLLVRIAAPIRFQRLAA